MEPQPGYRFANWDLGYGDVLGTITISIGVAQFRKGEGVETVVRRANACLYGAKHHGRNLVINQDDARRAELEPSAA